LAAPKNWFWSSRRKNTKKAPMSKDKKLFPQKNPPPKIDMEKGGTLLF